MVTKSRTYVGDNITGRTRSSAFVPWTVYSSDGPQSTETSIGTTNRWNGHCWDGGAGWILSRDIHSFSPRKSKPISTYNFSGVTLVGEGTTRIGGPTIGITSLSIPTRSSDSQLDAFGATAIARTEPTAPAFDLSTALGELMREGIPVAPGAQIRDRVKLAKASGSEYLNLEFGWFPLIRSINDFASVVDRADELTRSYQEHANIPIKRSYEWPTISETKFTPCDFSTENTDRGRYKGGGRFQSVMQKRWFEASYIYYLPVGSDNDAKMRRLASYARKLYGIDMSPEVLWNLAPWSWAVDWFSNTGDILHNVSAMGQDGMVLRYGHIMEHTVRVTTDTGVHPAAGGMTHVQTEEWKTRRPATPFGFGVSFSSLSAKQIAIISALGLSRW